MAALDPQLIKALLQRADDRWYAEHHGKYDYQEHLDFTVGYLVRNYKDRRKGEQERQRASCRG